MSWKFKGLVSDDMYDELYYLFNSGSTEGGAW